MRAHSNDERWHRGGQTTGGGGGLAKTLPRLARGFFCLLITSRERPENISMELGRASVNMNGVESPRLEVVINSRGAGKSVRIIFDYLCKYALAKVK